MNAGAYGSEMEKVVDRVEGITREGESVKFCREELTFSYRHACLPSGIIVTRVRLRLGKGEVGQMRLNVRGLVDRRKRVSRLVIQILVRCFVIPQGILRVGSLRQPG